MTFNENLKALRKNTGFSAKAFANILGISYTTYIQYEDTRKGRQPRLETICKMADILGISIDELIGHKANDGYAQKYMLLRKRIFEALGEAGK